MNGRYAVSTRSAGVYLGSSTATSLASTLKKAKAVSAKLVSPSPSSVAIWLEMKSMESAT